MRAAAFLLAFAATALAQFPEETPTPPPDPKIDFKVTVVGNRKEFHIGEIIPLKLSFSSRLKRRYQIDEAGYDRSGRMNFEHFIVVPADGAEDPLAEYFSPESAHIGGGLRGYSFLAQKPWTIQLNLNEWVRFTKAGEYKLRVASSRVDIVDSAKAHGTAPATARSNEVSLKILPRDPEWEKRTYDQAVATLQDPSSEKEDKTGDSRASRALETLRFLGTADATREMARQLRAEEPRRGQFDCYIGLISSPEREVARQALEEVLVDPDRPIFGDLLNALVWFEVHDKGQAVADGPKRVFERAANALAHKRGESLRVSLYLLLNENWVRGDKNLLAEDTLAKLITQLVATWDQLSLEQQTGLLAYRWDKIKTLTPLPILKRAAQHESTDLAGVALRRWFEVDLDGARRAIISEISRPRPRFDARRLGILPDKVLPEVEQPLRENLRGAVQSGNGANVASLIVRYGGTAILPQVLEVLDARTGTDLCDVQGPLLAYVLRADPESARPRIEKALVARKKKASACYQDLLSDIAVIHYDLTLEAIALRALDDPDDEVAASAAGILRGHGSATTESALWRRYAKWSKRWAGHESQINLQAVAAHRLNEAGRDDVSVGRSFVRAIAEGEGWLTDEVKLKRLKAMSKVPTIQGDIDRYLEEWHRSALALNIISCGPKRNEPSDIADLGRFWAKVAHYTFFSPDALEEKLSQFPPGTKCELSPPTEKNDRGCIDDLRAFLASHEFSVTDAKSDDGS